MNESRQRGEETRKRNKERREAMRRQEEAERQKQIAALRLVRDDPASTPTERLEAVKMLESLGR